MSPHGPIYCETGHPWLYMAEPVNTLTNIFILLAALLAYLRVRNSRIGFPMDISVLLFLLVTVGIGSFLWHGLRARWALQLDWIPGVLFLIVFSGFWIRMLFGGIAGFFGAIAMAGAAALSVVMWLHIGIPPGMPPNFIFIPAFVTIAIIGSFLVFVTNHQYGSRTAQIGGAVLLCGVLAATFRSIDPLTCAVIPFGTHFLWHILLATAAYLGITMLVRMKTHGRAMFG